MEFNFYKYQGTGNDFIMIDDRENRFDINDNALVAALCERRFGIGADGLILLRNHPKHDFEMIYFNADGFRSSMCGNGGRCVVSFANMLEIVQNETTFWAADGLHKAILLENQSVALQMQNVEKITMFQEDFVIDSGSPHYVRIVEDVQQLEVKKLGQDIRNAVKFKQEGINVNFVEVENDEITIRTFERGVEDETLSCGTGAVASAIAMHHIGMTNEDFITVFTLGGELGVSFEKYNNTYRNIWLYGPAEMVYVGEFVC